MSLGISGRPSILRTFSRTDILFGATGSRNQDSKASEQTINPSAFA